MTYKLVYMDDTNVAVKVGDKVTVPKGRAIVKEVSAHPELAPTLSVCLSYEDKTTPSGWADPGLCGMIWATVVTGSAVEFNKTATTELEKTIAALEIEAELDEDSDAVKHLIVQGNPVDGFNYYGPFDTPGEAEDYVLKYDNGESWWHAKMTRQM